MNILITGKNGFLAKEITSYYKDRADVNLILTDRKTLDPRCFLAVKDFFDNNKIDIVIHAAVRGGKRGHHPDIADIFDNLSMFQNLTRFSDKFQIMFNFGSGAEFDRARIIDSLSEDRIQDALPSDYYGLAKNLMSRQIVSLQSNIYNLRLFGCFGVYEEPQRLFRACYENFHQRRDAEIHWDKYMDYFYAQDVGRVMDHIIQHHGKKLPRDINLCYNEKYTLSQYAQKIKQLTKTDCCVIIHNKDLDAPYTGDHAALESLGIEDLTGLEGGLNECLTKWRKS